MSLRTSILIVLFAVIGAYVVINQSLLRFILLPSFRSLELAEARKDAQRVVEALEGEVDHLSQLSKDWSVWDDTYNFVVDRSEDFVHSNLVMSSFTKNKVNLLFIVDLKGAVVWGDTRDFHDGTGISLAPFTGRTTWPSGDPLFPELSGSAPDAFPDIAGIVVTAAGPLIVASQPILTSALEGPPRGRLVMGRLLDEDLATVLRRRTHVPFDLWTAESVEADPTEQRIFANISDFGEIEVRAINNGLLRAYTSFPDVSGAPALFFRVNLPRDIWARGRDVIRYTFMSLLAVGAIVLVVLHGILSRAVIVPLERLTAHTVETGKSGELRNPLNIPEVNEIGFLSQEFNRMAERLADTRDRLLRQSQNSAAVRQAGRIVHDIRNSLAPLLNKLETMEETLADWPLAKVRQALDELNRDTVPETRRRDLDGYVRSAAERFTTEADQLRGGIEEMLRGISMIETILARQESLTNADLTKETVPVGDLVADATALLPRSLAENLRVRSGPWVPDLPPVRTLRSMAAQVLSDLIIACSRAERADGDRSPGGVVITGHPPDATGSELVRIQVSTQSMPSESLANWDALFDRETSAPFMSTSHVDLHDCANVIISLGGTLHAQGREGEPGIAFQLHLPSAGDPG